MYQCSTLQCVGYSRPIPRNVAKVLRANMAFLAAGMKRCTKKRRLPRRPPPQRQRHRRRPLFRRQPRMEERCDMAVAVPGDEGVVLIEDVDPCTNIITTTRSTPTPSITTMTWPPSTIDEIQTENKTKVNILLAVITFQRNCPLL